jgi:hypothetical protein
VLLHRLGFYHHYYFCGIRSEHNDMEEEHWWLRSDEPNCYG